MAETINERKKTYYKLVTRKAAAIYASWEKKGVTSKQLAAKAYDYAYDKRLKTDNSYRFNVFAFAYALGMRIEKRYNTFFRKLFRLFAFIRERNALALLKRVVGFYSYTDIRVIIEAEAEKIAILLSRRNDNKTTGGGKRVGVEEVATEEEIENFINEDSLKEEQKTTETDLENDKEVSKENPQEPHSEKTDKSAREKISVDEVKAEEKSGAEKKDSSKEEKNKALEKEETAEKGKDNETIESKKQTEAKQTEKSVANTSILAEEMVAEQGREEIEPTPFPIFRDPGNSNSATGKNNDAIENKAQNETSTNAKNENVDRNARVETEQSKSVFPVFHGEKGGATNVATNSREKPSESLLESISKDMPQENSNKQEMYISEENKARLALNESMSDKQRIAYAEQLKEAAKLAMAREESAWREQVSVADNGNVSQPSSKVSVNPQNKGAVPQGVKR
jgi:hypothetical protein